MIRRTILGLPRYAKRLIVLCADLVLLPLAMWVSFSLRLGELYVPRDGIIYLYLAVPVIAIPIFIRFGLYRAIIRYIGFLAMWAVVKAVSLYSLIWGVLVLLTAIPNVPRSVLLINCLVTILLIGSSRAMARWWLSGSFNPATTNGQRKKVAIYGAGDTGRQIAAALVETDDFRSGVDEIRIGSRRWGDDSHPALRQQNVCLRLRRFDGHRRHVFCKRTRRRPGAYPRQEIFRRFHPRASVVHSVRILSRLPVLFSFCSIA